LPGEVQGAPDSLAPGSEIIEVHVSDLAQLFDAMDPSPFGARDLDPRAEDFIVGWAKEAPRGAPLGLRVHLDRSPGAGDEARALRDGVTRFFAERAEASRRRLRDLLRIGRISLVIGIAFLTVLTVVGHLVGDALRGHAVGEVARESLAIGGWVAMWRPLEVFLYGWWPIRRDARLYDRLSAMPVWIAYADAR
jgi:hypothetical protein